MANDKKSEKEYEQIIDNTKYVRIKVEDEMKKSFIAYAMAVNVSRAIPDARDGMKPVHRRILYSMNELGLDNDKPFRKCARIVGDVLGKYHPHGDASVYDALVRLAQDFSIRCPLVEGHGNFGSVDGDPAAAMRYTEARLSKIAAEMLRDIDKRTVDMGPNFDDTLTQPLVLPARYPNLLVNGSDGIAVGIATNIPPHNLGETIDGAIALIDNPDITVDELMQHIPCPDFPTGGLVFGRQGIKDAYTYGRGTCYIRAKTDIEEFNGGTRSRIVISELPYQVNKALLIEYIADMVKEKRIEGISDIKDESDRKGMRIVIDVKRDANAYVVLNTLFKHTKLQVSFGIINLALKNGIPTVMSLKELLHCFVDHQRDVITRRTKFDLEKAQEREHILKGLVIALDNLDEVIALIRSSDDKQQAQTGLMTRFSLSEKQANAILEIRLQRLVHLEIDKIKAELVEIEKAIERYNQILSDSHEVDLIIKNEMAEIKTKYNTPRRSVLTYDSSEINMEDLIAKEDVIISMTREGYIKRISADEYASQHRGGVGVNAHKTKDEDVVTTLFTCSTHDEIFMFSNKGRVYVLKGYDIPDASKNGKGRAMINLLPILEEGEKINTIMPIMGEIGRTGNLVLTTAKGKIKRTSMEEFQSIRKTGKIAISLDENDELVGAVLTTGENEVMIVSSSGKCIRFDEKSVRLMGRTAGGVKSMKLDEDDRIVDICVCQEGMDVLTITERGYGKRTDISEYRIQGRAGKGIKAGNFTEKTGKIVGVRLINAEEVDVMLITAGGMIIRTHANEISRVGRNSQGVRIMKVKENASNMVVTVAIGPRFEEEKEEIKDAPETTALISAENADNEEINDITENTDNTDNAEITEENEDTDVTKEKEESDELDFDDDKKESDIFDDINGSDDI